MHCTAAAPAALLVLPAATAASGGGGGGGVVVGCGTSRDDIDSVCAMFGANPAC